MPKNSNYTISKTHNKTVLVKLEYQGIQKIAQYYQEKFGFKIFIETSKYTAKSFSDILPKHQKEMKSGEFRPIIWLDRFLEESEEYFHASPLILAKNESELILANFCPKGVFKRDGIDFDLKEKNVLEYENKQSDGSSCAVFAFYALVNCMRDLKFKEFIFGDKAEFAISKKTIFQRNVDFDKEIEETKQPTYLFTKSDFKHDYEKFEEDSKKNEPKPKDFNLKAFYKGHCFAQRLNENHFFELGEFNRRKILEIEKTRKKGLFTKFLKEKPQVIVGNVKIQKMIEEVGLEIK